ncbi:MAG: HPr family phosphocarrier protein [Clostridiales bacterium]|nr:HPr family phosphocarrier protein [Clostridiales bacterium]MCD8370046.1 HPr family phosphocarrier protein [Clostridiales bacterium]
MQELKVTFRNPNDVLDFVSRVEKYPFNMDLSRGSIVVDAKSLLGIMNLGFNEAVNLKIYSDENCEALFTDIEKFTAA